MGFLPSPADGVSGRSPGTIDYRLAREAVVKGFRVGEFDRSDICDAHPELRRAAKECSESGGEKCPICEQDELRLVRYVFGPRLPKHGRCVTSAAELARLSRRRGDFTCYIVEVCPSCAWNHLRQSQLLGDSS